MNWLKTLLSFLPLFIFSAYLPLSMQSTEFSNPNSNLNLTVATFDEVFKLSGLSYKLTDISLPRKEITVVLPQTTAYLSLISDPYLQVADLQSTLKNANIIGRHVQVIDLNTNHPYATLTDR